MSGGALHGVRPPRRTEILYRAEHRGGDEQLPFRHSHRLLFVAIDDRACFEENRRHAGVLEHNELIVAIDSCLRIDQQALPMAHEFLGVMVRVYESARLQLFAEKAAELEAGSEI